MSSAAWDPHELKRLRQRLQQLHEELQNVEGRLAQLEQIAVHHFAERATPAGEAPAIERPSSPPPPIPAMPISASSAGVEAPALQPPPLASMVLPAAAFPSSEIEELHLAPEEPRLAGAGQQGFQGTAVPQAGHIERPKAHRQPTRSTVDWEAIIGGRWMTWAGAFSLLLAVGFGVHWAWTTLQTPPWMHVLAFHLLGVGFLGAAYFLLRRGVPLAVQALVGLGIFTLYAAAFAALHLYHQWDQQTAFLECAAITALAIGLAVRAGSPAVVLLGALGGYLTPILTASDSGNYAGLFTYLAFLNVALVACAVWRQWSFLKPLALAATAIMFLGWLINDHFDPENSLMIWNTEWFAVLHAAIFLIGGTLPPLAWKRTSRTADVLALAAGSFFFLGITWLLFHDRPQQHLAWVCWGLAALHAVLFALAFVRLTHADRMPRVHLALAAVFFTLAIPLQLNDADYWSLTWCVEGFVFTAVGIYFADRQMCITAVLVLLLSAGRLLGWDWHAPARTLGHTPLDLHFVMFLAGGLLTMFSAGLYRLIPWAWRKKQPPRLEQSFAENTAALLSAVGAVLITLSPLLQLHDLTYLAPVWAVEALLFTVVGLACRDWQLRATALVVFALAAGRLLGFDFMSAARPWGNTNFDIRSVAFSLVGLLALGCGAVYRIQSRKNLARAKDQPASATPSWSMREAADLATLASILLLGLGALLITCAAPLDLIDWSWLAPIWAVEALLFITVAAVVYDLLLGIIGLVIFATAAVRLGGWDFAGPPHTIAGTSWDARFVAMELSGLIAVVAGGMYWLIPRWQGRRTSLAAAAENSLVSLSEIQHHRVIGGMLLAAGNVTLLLGLTCQWDNRFVLMAWTLDVALIWAAGFRLDHMPTRWYCATLALLLVGGRALHDGATLAGPFQLLLNTRFASLALVSILYFAAGSLYRRRVSSSSPLASESRVEGATAGTFAELQTDESLLDPLFGILANATLLVALSLEIHSWFMAAIAAGRTPFPDMRMAEMATYSIVWAIYAALMVAVGFVARYQLFRLLGLAAFGIIVLKVFFIDLESLRWFPRVLALAVLGITLLGVSMLYQKFFLKTQQTS